MSINFIVDEVERVKCISEIFDYLSKEVDKIQDQSLRQDIYNKLCDLETLTYKSPEWECRGISNTVNMAIFGSKSSGQRTVLTKSLLHDFEKYSSESGIRFKHVVTLKDQSQQLLTLRSDSDFLPFPSICDWTDCALFMFDVSDENSYKHALYCHNKFLELTKDSIISIPTILVGIKHGAKSDVIINRHQSYYDLLVNAKEQKFHKYLEVQPNTSENINYLFEYATEYTVKQRKLALSVKGTENIDTNKVVTKRKSRVSIFKMPVKVDKKNLSTNDTTPKKKLSSVPEKATVNRKESTKGLFKKSFHESMLSLSTMKSCESYEEKPEWFSCQKIKQGALTKVKGINSTIYMTVTSNGDLFYHNSEKGYNEGKKPSFIDLLTNTVKKPGDYTIRVNSDSTKTKKKHGQDNIFQIIGQKESGGMSVRTFKAESSEERDSWVTVISDAIYRLLEKNVMFTKIQSPEILDTMTAIKSLPGNGVCADCDAPEATWMNCNLGIFVCLRCSGLHRKQFKCQSTQLDSIEPIIVKIMSVLGNIIVNSIFEANLELSDVRKPEPGAEDIEQWFNMKYKEKKFIAPIPIEGRSISSQLMLSISEKDYRTQLLLIHNATKEQLDERYSEVDERTALFIAAQSGLPISVQLLIWANVDCHHKDSRGINAYGYASYAQSPDHSLVQALLHGSDVAIQKLGDTAAEAPVAEAEEAYEPLYLVTKRKK